jgi:hypothetical protein
MKRGVTRQRTAEDVARAFAISTVALAALASLFVWGPRSDVLNYLSQVTALLVLAVVALWPK